MSGTGVSAFSTDSILPSDRRSTGGVLDVSGGLAERTSNGLSERVGPPVLLRSGACPPVLLRSGASPPVLLRSGVALMTGLAGLLLAWAGTNTATEELEVGVSQSNIMGEEAEVGMPLGGVACCC